MTNNSNQKDVIDITGKLAASARAEARRLAKANRSLLDMAAVNMHHWQDLHYATLSFLACTDLYGFARVITETLPSIFDLASAQLIMAKDSGFQEAKTYGFIICDEAEIATIFPAGSVWLGQPDKAIIKNTQLFSSPPASIAALALPDQLPAPVAGSLLVLVGRNDDSFVVGQGQNLLINLAEITGVALMSHLERAGLLKL